MQDTHCILYFLSNYSLNPIHVNDDNIRYLKVTQSTDYDLNSTTVNEPKETTSQAQSPAIDYSQVITR